MLTAKQHHVVNFATQCPYLDYPVFFQALHLELAEEGRKRGQTNHM